MDHQRTIGIGTAFDFPPTPVVVDGRPSPECPATALDGLLLPPVGDPTPDRQVVVGFRLASGSTRGSIDGLTVTYTAAGEAFKTFLPESLHVLQADTSGLRSWP